MALQAPARVFYQFANWSKTRALRGAAYLIARKCGGGHSANNDRVFDPTLSRWCERNPRPVRCSRCKAQRPNGEVNTNPQRGVWNIVFSPITEVSDLFNEKESHQRAAQLIAMVPQFA
jgi:hypothetical protein